MGLFSKKKDAKNIKDFDIALSNLNSMAQKFRSVHFSSVETFEKNFEKQKTEKDLQNERALFETHLELLQHLKLETDNLLDEALKIVRDETVLTERDRTELRKLLDSKRTASTNIKVKSKKDKKA